jgi:gamma-glutamylcyclotransferase (GGCT)/AIG2-like uncharacterized protein YtfP
MSKDAGIRVFVYGTLKFGHPNHHVLKGGTLLGRCFIEGGMKMLDLGFYPAVVPAAKETGRVYGEVYLINEDILNHLDILEGHPHYFTRLKRETPWKKAWVYFMPETYANEEKYKVVEEVWQPSDAEKEFING